MYHNEQPVATYPSYLHHDLKRKKKSKKQEVNLVKPNPYWTNNCINSGKNVSLAIFPLLGTLFLTSGPLHSQKRKGSFRLPRRDKRKDWKTNPCCLNSKIITYWSHLFFPEVPDETDTVRHLLCRAPVFFKSCSENICVLFKSRTKFLMPNFLISRKKIKGTHAFPSYCHVWRIRVPQFTQHVQP